jgi:signal transduction histidine kinase
VAAGELSQVRVVIRDNGAGIPADAVERVFEPDFTTKPRGTGLGLAIAQQNIRAHGGRIELKRRPEGGTEVVILLPALTLIEPESGA